MRFLILLSEYLPDQNPNVYRWAAIAEHWAEAGHEVHLLTSKRHGSSNYEIINQVQVHRTGQSTMLDWVSNLLRLKKRRGRHIPGIAIKQNGLLHFLRILLEILVDYTWRFFYWPDGSCIWYFPARKKAAKIIRAQKVDVIITICYPFTALLVGRYLKRKFPRVKWLIDIEDPFSIASEPPKNNLWLYRNLNHKQEGITLKEADIIVMTNENMKSIYDDRFFTGKKSFIIPPLWDDRIKPNDRFNPALEKNKTHLAYVGSFYSKVREPDVLLSFLRQWKKVYPENSKFVCVHIIGEIPHQFINTFKTSVDLGAMIKFHGFLPRDKVTALMQSVDFLINVGNTTTFQLPSKVVDYYATGKPVLNICQVENDSFKAFFKEYTLIHNIYRKAGKYDGTELAACNRFVEVNKGVHLDFNKLGMKLEEYTAEAIADKYLETLNFNDN